MNKKKYLNVIEKIKTHSRDGSDLHTKIIYDSGTTKTIEIFMCLKCGNYTANEFKDANCFCDCRKYNQIIYKTNSYRVKSVKVINVYTCPECGNYNSCEGNEVKCKC